MDNILTSILGVGIIGGFIFNPLIRNKYNTYKIHKEISQILKESIKNKKYEYHMIKSTQNDFVRLNGWIFDPNNINIKKAIFKLNNYYENVKIIDNKSLFNYHIFIKAIQTKNKNDVEIEFNQENNKNKN